MKKNQKKYNYGVITYKHRFSLTRSLDDYKETTLTKCICMSIEYKYKNMVCDKPIAEVQIVYKDEKDNLCCLCKDLHDFTFSIKHQGDMRITL